MLLARGWGLPLAVVYCAQGLGLRISVLRRACGQRRCRWVRQEVGGLVVRARAHKGRSECRARVLQWVYLNAGELQ